MIHVRLAAFGLALSLALGATASPAAAYGPATHAALGRTAAGALAGGARTAFLGRDEGLRNCFLLGSIFPDAGQVPALAPTFERLKREIEASRWVREVKLSTAEIGAYPPAIRITR